jgi:DnaK suppressor protein
MDNTLNDARREELHALLLQRRAALADQRSAHLGGSSRVEHARDLLLQDGDDETQRDAEREVDFARTDRDSVELAEIDQALARLEAGQYGVCADCGEAIALARLRSAPQALRCVACESQRERWRPRAASL